MHLAQVALAQATTPSLLHRVWAARRTQVLFLAHRSALRVTVLVQARRVRVDQVAQVAQVVRVVPVVDSSVPVVPEAADLTVQVARVAQVAPVVRVVHPVVDSRAQALAVVAVVPVEELLAHSVVADHAQSHASRSARSALSLSYAKLHH